MAGNGVYVDSDSHVMEPEAIWQEYTPAKYRTLAPQAVEKDGVYYIMIEGRVFDGLPIAAAGIPNGLNDLEKTRHTKWSEIPSGAKEPHARVAVLDEEGLTASVLYPTIGLLYAAIRSAEVAAASCEAYNRWMADFCRAAPKRLFGVATLPLQDIDAAVKVLERAAKLGLRGATIRPTPYNHRRLCDASYDQFWATAQDLDMPISVHGSFAVDTVESVCSDRYPNNDLFFSHMICHPLEQEMASMDILAGGVLERFPRLKVSFLEAGAGWMMYWLDRTGTTKSSARSSHGSNTSRASCSGAIVMSRMTRTRRPCHMLSLRGSPTIFSGARTIRTSTAFFQARCASFSRSLNPCRPTSPTACCAEIPHASITSILAGDRRRRGARPSSAYIRLDGFRV